MCMANSEIPPHLDRPLLLKASPPVWCVHSPRGVASPHLVIAPHHVAERRFCPSNKYGADSRGRLAQSFFFDKPATQGALIYRLGIRSCHEGWKPCVLLAETCNRLKQDLVMSIFALIGMFDQLIGAII